MLTLTGAGLSSIGVVAPAGLYFGTMAKNDWKLSPVYPILCACFVFVALCCLTMLFWVDPTLGGTRSQPADVRQDVREASSEPYRLDKAYFSTFRYCHLCYEYRIRDSRHCERCGGCVDHHVHHSVLLGTCIARKNYLYFYTLMLSTTLFASLMIVSSAVDLRHRIREKRSLAISIVNIVWAGLVLPVPLWLLVRHTFWTIGTMFSHFQTANKDADTQDSGPASIYV